MDKPPACGNPRCRRGIRACAPCCRHGGWVHRHNGEHACGDPEGVTAYLDLGPTMSPAPRIRPRGQGGANT
jgi:hypothetical protein